MHSLVTRSSWLVLTALLVGWQAAASDPLLTVAERSEFRATARHAEVVEWCDQLAKSSPVVRVGELGKSVEGRRLPLLILSDPPVATAEEAARSGKLVVFAMGNIHAGEVDGKEALLMLAREIVTAENRPLLEDLVIVLAPIFNADGNEKVSKTNRPGQLGPEEGMGQRPNAQGLDLNRDFVKLETPEVQALVKFFNEWDPAVVIDTHTTNGSRHRYTITFDGPRHPAAHPDLVRYVRDTFLPAIAQRMEEETEYDAFFYGNFSDDLKRWEPYPAQPRFGTQYVGLRGRIAILCESYAYAPYRDRVLATRDFVRECFEYAAANKEKVREVVSSAVARRAAMSASSVERRSTRPGSRASSKQVAAEGGRPSAAAVAIAHRLVPAPQPVLIRAFSAEEKQGKLVPTERHEDYQLEYLGHSEATKSVDRPAAYIFPASFEKAVAALQRHGIMVVAMQEDIDLEVETYRVEEVTREERAFQNHRLVSLEVSPTKESRRVEAGSIVVRTDQPLAALIVNLLEPHAEDGLTTWNFFDESIEEGREFPVLRLMASTPLITGRARPIADRKTDQPITFELYASAPSLLSGSPTSISTWLDDDHFLQVKPSSEGARSPSQLYRVHASTGRATPFIDQAKLAGALAKIPAIDRNSADAMAARTSFDMNSAHNGALFNHANDLYFARLDGTQAVRLTKTPAPEELASFSPDGRFVAFVRENNLYVVDVETQTERQLTTDGSEVVSNGKADWVYFEEIFGRSWKAYWWSPDSNRIAFLRFDDTPVHKFTVINHLPVRQTVEQTPYPKAGDPNPLVKLGVASVSGEPVAWPDFGNYSESSSLIVRAGFTPDSRSVYFYVQDRAQTWLDVLTASVTGGSPTRLFRETTEAFVEDPGEITFLKDGSFLLPSERTGWRHFYRFNSDGSLRGPITSGEWEARTLHHVDEEAGWLYVSGTRDSHLASNLYRVKLDGGEVERLTKPFYEPGQLTSTVPTLPSKNGTEAERIGGDHKIVLSPNAKYFVDSWSSHRVPTQVRLYRTDGQLERVLNTNPVYALEEYRLGHYELVQIPRSNGPALEGSLLKPPGFDPSKRYPVWFKTYGGPHAPTIQDKFSGDMLADQLLANSGFIVFRADPYSASGKGARATWTAYRQLGVPELADIKTAIEWLIDNHSLVDRDRIGMSGHSYGGFMTAYAMTHTKLFAAGISGAPVTDWHNYDTIYTERYMNTPQENPEGYRKTSVVKAAGNLHGRLLILHGIMDDNVHLQNAVQLIHELQRADKEFEVMFYPQARHGLSGRHYQRIVYNFIVRTLGERPPSDTTSDE